MKPRVLVRPVPPDAGVKRKLPPKHKKIKYYNIPGHHHTSSNRTNKLYNNNLYNHKAHNVKENNNKAILDSNASNKHGRNSSAPHLKQDQKANEKINKSTYNYNNTIEYNEDDSLNKHSYDKIKNQNKIKKPEYYNRNTNYNHHINNIKQNFNTKESKKHYNNSLYYDSINLINSTNKNNYNTIDVRGKPRDQNSKDKYIIKKGKKEYNSLLKKKLKDNSYNEKSAIDQKMKNNKLKNQNKSVNNNYKKYLNNTINYHQVNNINIQTIDNDDEDKNIVIDNEEKILKTDVNLPSKENIDHDNENEYQVDSSRDVTPNKNNETNNLESIATISSKIGTDNSKDAAKKEKNKKNVSKSEYSYSKSNNRNEKDLFKNNYNIYSNTIYTDRINKKSKSKKIKLVNYPKVNDYHFTKSTNAFNVAKKNKNINRTKFNVSYDGDSSKKMKMSSDKFNQNKDIFLNKFMAKKSNNKLKANRENNRSLNYTKDKKNTSTIKRQVAKGKPQKIEKIKKEELNEEENKQEEEKLIKSIVKIGCICHAGEISVGKEKINQDNYFNYKINADDLVFVGVCDGHGENGHHVSDFLINHLPQDFQESYINLKEAENKEFEDISKESITKAFEESFQKTDNDLNQFCDDMKKKKLKGDTIPNFFNCDYSGSTCVSILLKQNDIKSVYIANVGDSRTIIIRENNEYNWTFEQLSRDHKPTEKDEYQRIIDADGEIEAIEDDDGNWTGPLRVWEKGSEGPGLAMTRSLGDKVGSKIGVVCTPEVFRYSINEEDRAIIVASDGLWEYMSNQNVTDAVKELVINMRKENENNEVDADYIANDLFKKSVEKWRQKEQGMDDITIICVLLK